MVKRKPEVLDPSISSRSYAFESVSPVGTASRHQGMTLTPCQKARWSLIWLAASEGAG